MERGGKRWEDRQQRGGEINREIEREEEEREGEREERNGEREIELEKMSDKGEG